MIDKLTPEAEEALNGSRPAKQPHDEPFEMGDDNSVRLDDNHVSTVQELLNAIWALPGVMDKVDAYMRGRGIDDPQEEICELRRIVF